MQRVLWLSVLAVCCGMPGFAAETYTEADFSYQVPAGWRLLPPQSVYKIAAGPRKGPVSPNINIASLVRERAFKMEGFEGEVLGNLQKDSPNARKTGSSDFKTESGLDCRKVSFTNEEQGKKLLEFYYLFSGQGKSVIVLCTTTPEDAAAEEQFDAAMKTFAIQK